MSITYAEGAVPQSSRGIRDMEWVSEHTGIPLGTLRYYRLHGRGPRSFKLGRRVVYDEADVWAFIDAARAAS